MQKKHYKYLLELQFLGFRYHGWQKQPGVKTVQHMLDRTIKHVIQKDNFRTLGSSRTDAMVSALQHMSLIISKEEIDWAQLFIGLNKNLPHDMRAISLKPVHDKFEILGNTKSKEYHYFFSFGEKAHPFSAPYMVNFQEELDIELMQKAARAFEGEHNFKSYCYRVNENKVLIRSVDSSIIVPNSEMGGSFFSTDSYVFKVRAAGFLHHQVRLMMGSLIKLGCGEITYDEFLASLKGEDDYPIGFIAPSSGLILYKSEFNHE